MPLNSHDLDDDGEHDPNECELCLEKNCTIACECRCGNCCEKLIIEVSLRDGERESRIQECSPVNGITGAQIGYLLNDPANDYACRFFDRTARLCTIHETRPLVCRLFDCDTADNDDDD